MSKSRAKKKRRQRARPAGGPPHAKADGAAGAKAGGVASANAGGGPSAKAGRAAGANPSRVAGAKAGGAAGAKRGGGPKGREATGSKGGRAAASRARGTTTGGGDGATRPDAIWAPFPLTEIGMAVGLVIFGAGYATKSTWLLAIGAGLLTVVVGELCLREHLSGFRSHVLLLSALTVVAGHTIVVLAITDAWKGPIALAGDLALGGALAWWLRSRYRIALERNNRTR